MKKQMILLGICSAAAGYSLLPTAAEKLRNRIKRLNRPDTERIFLSFDDGPDAHYTGRLLDLLGRYGIKACFFVVASFAEQNGELLLRMKQEGHRIGLHSVSHQNGLMMPPNMVIRDFEEGIRILNEIGIEPAYYRPPWGHWNLSIEYFVRKYRLKPVLWNVMAEDWRADSTPEEICRKICHRIRGGDMICLHDGRGAPDAPERMICGLKLAIPKLLERGFIFDSVEHYVG